jgi:hypothetical protein
MNLKIICIIFCMFGVILTDCPDTNLYCFDIMSRLLGNIRVNQCWRWERISCQPCSASIENIKITYRKYIYHCRYYYPKTVEILERDSVLMDRIRYMKTLIIGGNKVDV